MANSLRSTTQARSVLAIIAVLLAPIGSAQQPEAQTNAPASMEKETPSQGKQLILQSAVGLDELSADKVVKHIARSMNEDARGLLTNWIDGNVVRLKPDPQS